MPVFAACGSEFYWRAAAVVWRFEIPLLSGSLGAKPTSQTASHGQSKNRASRKLRGIPARRDSSLRILGSSAGDGALVVALLRNHGDIYALDVELPAGSFSLPSRGRGALHVLLVLAAVPFVRPNDERHAR